MIFLQKMEIVQKIKSNIKLIIYYLIITHYLKYGNNEQVSSLAFRKIVLTYLLLQTNMQYQNLKLQKEFLIHIIVHIYSIK